MTRLFNTSTFTIISRAHKDKFHLSFDDALRIRGDTTTRPLTKLRQLSKGEIDKINLPYGTLVKFIMPGK